MATLLVGAVAYTPNAVTIWEGIREHFRGHEPDLDFILFSNYERQVDALLAGTIDIAWNTNLAWVRTHAMTGGLCRALAMRDADVAFTTVLVARAGSGLRGLESLRGKRLALGSRDSAQAAILPLHFVREAGLEDDVEVIRFNSDVGKHGDTGRSELDAIRAVLADEADVAAMGISTWTGISAGDAFAGLLEPVWESPAYCHCNFTALPGLEQSVGDAWVGRLLEMSWDKPDDRAVMELEGVKEWVLPQLEGYDLLFRAVADQKVPARR